MKKVLVILLTCFSFILVGCSSKVETVSITDYAFKFSDSFREFMTSISKYDEIYANSDNRDVEQFKTAKEVFIDFKDSLVAYKSEDEELNNLHDTFVNYIQEVIYSLDTYIELLEKGDLDDPNLDTELDNLKTVIMEVEDTLYPIGEYLEGQGITLPEL